MYAHNVWPRTAKFGMIIHVAVGRVSTRSHRPQLEGRDPPSQILFDTLPFDLDNADAQSVCGSQPSCCNTNPKNDIYVGKTIRCIHSKTYILIRWSFSSELQLVNRGFDRSCRLGEQEDPFDRSLEGAKSVRVQQDYTTQLHMNVFLWKESNTSHSSLTVIVIGSLFGNSGFLSELLWERLA